MNNWLFTDPHFNHANLVKRGNRPEGYENLIRESWLASAKDGDTVYCLGDVCMGKQAASHEVYVMPMPGRKILIRGNHDNQKDAWYLSHGWDEVHETLMVDVNGQKVLLSHFPQSVQGKFFHMNIHGHFHNDLHRAMQDEYLAIRNSKQKLLALECVDYKLVLLADFVAGKVIQTGLPEY